MWFCLKMRSKFQLKNLGSKLKILALEPSMLLVNLVGLWFHIVGHDTTLTLDLADTYVSKK